MKKIFALLLALVMVLALAACGETQPDGTAGATEPTGESQTQTQPSGDNQGGDTTASYSFEFGGVKLIPGQAFKADTLPAADFVYEVPSCAIEGTDQVYSYGVMEVTAFNDGTGPVIYSIFLADANTPTGEGLYIGDPLSTVTELYGEDCAVSGNQYTYTANGTMLILLVENGYVASIEYRMVTE